MYRHIHIVSNTYIISMHHIVESLGRSHNHEAQRSTSMANLIAEGK